MKMPPAVFILIFLFVTVSACFGGGSIDCEDAIPWQQASEHLDESAVVRGPVVDAIPGFDGSPAGGSAAALLIGVGQATEAGPIGFLVWIQNFDRFPEPPELAYDGETICVRGLVTGSGGEAKAGPWWIRPSIAIQSPDDIKVVE